METSRRWQSLRRKTIPTTSSYIHAGQLASTGSAISEPTTRTSHPQQLEEKIIQHFPITCRPAPRGHSQTEGQTARLRSRTANLFCFSIAGHRSREIRFLRQSVRERSEKAKGALEGAESNSSSMQVQAALGRKQSLQKPMHVGWTHIVPVPGERLAPQCGTSAKRLANRRKLRRSCRYSQPHKKALHCGVECMRVGEKEFRARRKL